MSDGDHDSTVVVTAVKARLAAVVKAGPSAVVKTGPTPVVKSGPTLVDCSMTTAEKATNTECVAGPVGGPRLLLKGSADHQQGASSSTGGALGGAAMAAMMGPALIKRSQTFTPSVASSAAMPSSYICKVGRVEGGGCG